jgi:hypothetical protein
MADKKAPVRAKIEPLLKAPVDSIAAAVLYSKPGESVMALISANLRRLRAC